MSDYGLIIKTPSGGIQIDSIYRNYCRQSEGTATITNDNTNAGYFTTIAIAASPLLPLTIIQPNTDYFVDVIAYHKTDDNYDSIAITTDTNISTIINWEVYRETFETSSENYGFRIWNPSNKLVFDSGKSYFKIHAVESITLANPDPDNLPYVDIAHVDISNPFYILSPGSIYFTFTPLGDGISSIMRRYKIGIKKLSATSVRVGWFICGSSRPPFISTEVGGWNPTQKLLICKV